MQDTSSNPKSEPGKLPVFLFEPFQRYKRDTDRLASWLGATAHSLGYTHTSPTSTTQPAAAPGGGHVGRLKGKARKLAQQAAAAAAAASASASQPTDPADRPTVTTFLSTSQFVTLAEFIVAATDPPVRIPMCILDWARRAIRARRKCAQWFQEQSLAAATDTSTKGIAQVMMERSNRSHEHFIGVLEAVVAVLATSHRVRVGGFVAPRAKSAKAGSGVDVGQGRFSALIDDQVGQDDDDVDAEDDDGQDDWDVVDKLVQATVGGRTQARISAPSTQRTAAKSTSTAAATHARTNASNRTRHVYRAASDDPMEFFHAYTAHLNDMFDAKQVVMQTWADYYTAKLSSLDVAGLVTTAAVDAVQAGHDSLRAEYPTFMEQEQEHADYFFDISVLLAKRAAGLCSREEEELVPLTEMAPVDMTTQWFVDVTCARARWALEAFQLGVEHDVDTPHAVGSESSPKSNLPSGGAEWKEQNADKCEQDLQTLRRLSSTWAQIKTVFDPFRSSIPVISTLESLKSTTTRATAISLPHRFAVQLYLDLVALTAHDATTAASRVSKDYIFPSVAFLHSMYQCVANVPDMDLRKAPGMFDKYRAIHPCVSDRGMPNIQPLCNVHPWAAGVLLGRARALVLDHVCELEDSTAVVSIAVFLHTAVELASREFGLDDHGDDDDAERTAAWWPVMDQFVGNIGAHRMFFGKQPQSLVDVWKSFAMHTGISSVDMALVAAPPAGRESAVRANMRRMDRPGFVLRPFVDAAMDPVAKAVCKRIMSQDGGTDKAGGVAELHRLLGDCNAKVAAVVAGGKSESKQLKSLGIQAYLESIRSHLIQHQPLMTHDIFLLRAQASRALTRLNAIFTPHMPLLLPNLPKKHDSNVFRVGMFITALVPADSRDPAAHMALLASNAGQHGQHQRRVLEEIVREIRQFVQDMIVADEKFSTGGELPPSGEEGCAAAMAT